MIKWRIGGITIMLIGFWLLSQQLPILAAASMALIIIGLAMVVDPTITRRLLD